MEMVPFRTTPESLSFNARMTARLCAPIAFFYLGWIAENGTQDGSWVYGPGNVSIAVPYNRSEGTSNTTEFLTQVVYSPVGTVMHSAFAEFYQLQVSKS